MFYCEFPYCDYKTSLRSQIAFHHILPRSLGGNKDNDPKNILTCCHNCHSKIYIPEITNGIHSKKNEDSIIIKKWFLSNEGRILNYIDSNGDEQFYRREKYE